MAKKKKRAVKKQRTSEPREGEEPEQYEEGEEMPHPGIPRVTVTWHGDGTKTWYGIPFATGVATPVEHSPYWDAMRKTIDADRNSSWSYAYVVEQPTPEEPPPPPEGSTDPQSTPARSSRR